MRNSILLLAFLVVLSACQPENIGGQKDEYGCLSAAGYSWNSTIGACVRPWELDENQAKAAQIAIAPISARPVTVVSVLTLRCPGCFIVNVVSGNTEAVMPIKIINWTVSHEIISFEECVAAGNPVMESYPRKCSAEGKTFIEEIDPGLMPEISPFVKCTEEQKAAEMCTMEYLPVCGDNGKTYGNKCSACASKEIDAYMPGECTSNEEEKKYLTTNPEQCNTMGIWKCDEGYSVFMDETGCGCKKNILDDEYCQDSSGNKLSLNEAIVIAKASECGDHLILSCPSSSADCERTYFCNEGTGTYWINLNITKPGCSPACVINVETKKAEINWRCTGLLPD